MFYKLCYYTTPFEHQGLAAIMNVSYAFPTFPPYSDRLKRLISTLLQQYPWQRPNIYQTFCEICKMRNVPIHIYDIYNGKNVSSCNPSGSEYLQHASKLENSGIHQSKSSVFPQPASAMKPMASPMLPNVNSMPYLSNGDHNNNGNTSSPVSRFSYGQHTSNVPSTQKLPSNFRVTQGAPPSHTYGPPPPVQPKPKISPTTPRLSTLALADDMFSSTAKETVPTNEAVFTGDVKSFDSQESNIIESEPLSASNASGKPRTSVNRLVDRYNHTSSLNKVAAAPAPVPKPVNLKSVENPQNNISAPTPSSLQSSNAPVGLGEVESKSVPPTNMATERGVVGRRASMSIAVNARRVSKPEKEHTNPNAEQGDVIPEKPMSIKERMNMLMTKTDYEKPKVEGYGRYTDVQQTKK